MDIIVSIFVEMSPILCVDIIPPVVAWNSFFSFVFVFLQASEQTSLRAALLFCPETVSDHSLLGNMSNKLARAFWSLSPTGGFC